MFLLTSPDETPVTASFKTTSEQFEQLLGRPGFTPASHLARYHWVHLDDVARLSPGQGDRFVRESYALVVAKPPARLRRELAAGAAS